MSWGDATIDSDDIAPTQYTLTGDVSSGAVDNESITGFSFTEANVAAFEAICHVAYDTSGTDLYETFKLVGTQEASGSWNLEVEGYNDNVPATFDLNSSAGTAQMRVSFAQDATYTGCKFNFRALTVNYPS